MWFLAVLVPAAMSVMAAVSSLTGGMTFVVAAVVTGEWQHRKGYKPGEGRFTERAADTYYGVMFDKGSEYELNQDLARLAAAAPGLLGKFTSKKFDLTVSEAGLLKSLMLPVMAIIDDFEATKELALEQIGQETMDLLIAMTDQLALVVIPVARWLEQFPGTRVKEVS